MLRRWVEEKYHLPWNHEVFQDLTVLELLTMYWEDYYLKHPVDARRTKSGHVVYQTGDPLIDKWERELEAGLEPDLTEGLSSEERAKEKQALERAKRRAGQTEREKDLGEGFDDDYSKMAAAATAPPLEAEQVDEETRTLLTQAGVALLGEGVKQRM
jgi:hypothetical protein